MKIYLAARFSRREELIDYADSLKEDGHEITSSWVYGGEDGLSREDIAKLDVCDVLRADMVVLFTEPYGTAVAGGGRHTEFGIGLGTGKKLAIVGEREQIFCWYPGVIQEPSVNHLRRYLKGK